MRKNSEKRCPECGRKATKGDTCGYHTVAALARFQANAFPKHIERRQV